MVSVLLQKARQKAQQNGRLQALEKNPRLKILEIGV